MFYRHEFSVESNFVNFFRLFLLVCVLVDSHQVLGNAEEVDHLSYAKERGYDDHATERALKEGSWSLLQQKYSSTSNQIMSNQKLHPINSKIK